MPNSKYLNKLASFLLEKDRLCEAVNLNIQAARNHRSNIIDTLGQRSEEEIIAIFTQSLGNFLKAIADNKGFDNIFDSFVLWKKNNYNLPSAKIQASDILMTYEIRKDVLTKLISTYTCDTTENLLIQEELDALFFIARTTGMNYIENSY